MENQRNIYLEQKENGETIAHVGEYQFLVLENLELENKVGAVLVVLKDLLVESMRFGKNNDFRESDIRPVLRDFAKKIEDIVGAENLLEHSVDLTSDDGLKDYGTVMEKTSLLTTELYRRYVDVLDIDRLQKYYWLVTPYSTPRHDDDEWVKCASPRGGVDTDYYSSILIGVRPFCIFKSDIFVS